MTELVRDAPRVANTHQFRRTASVCYSLCFDMEGDTEDEDGLFDLGDDDDQVDDDDVAGELVPIEQQDDLQQQATYPTDEGETLLEALSVREEGAMGNDPYNSEDWDVLAGAEAEAG